MKILVAGDFCPRYRVADVLEKSDFKALLGEVKNNITEADYSIVNFECAITRGGERPISKLGPNLGCSEKGMEAIKWCGFDCVTLANNHFFDYGEEGVRNTIIACNKYDLDYVGGGNNISEASKILYKQIDGRSLAIINCCEHEFSIATDNTGGSNPLNPIQQYYSIQEAKKNADRILVIVHGGHEHYQLPSPRMVETYRFFIDAGADAVVNHHQHCYSGYEIYKGKPIIYGLGNFCFDIIPIRSNDLWNFGCFVEITFLDDIIKYKLIPIRQCDESPCVKIADQSSFESTIDKINVIIKNEIELKKMTKSYYKDSMSTCESIINPSNNRYIRALQRRKLLPNLISKDWMLRLQNFTICEAHRDKMDYFFTNFE